ncbi:MAG: Na+/H+ antiporter NhaC family protein [Clostridia bacterium]|nr:Na+/H+ antiporter NhaC family protein [Clostridia bacterium]
MNTNTAKKVSRFLLAAFVLSILSVFAVFATGDTAEAAAEAAELPGYATFVIENELAEAGLENADYAQAYIDNYDTAVQSDDNKAVNYEEAVAVVRENSTPFFASIWGLLPPVIAILLALITKEVYSSLFVGIAAGALLYANFNLETAYNTIVVDGFIASLSDSWNVGIIVFLVVLGAFVALMNKAGGSAAYGRWASKNIKTKRGALLSTFVLGCLIFIDDYFNCLTVGSVMRPVTDSQKISRAKLAYIIDATAAPICMIAPISSWAAAVSGFAPEGVNGIQLFCQAIPYNFYSLLTIVAIIVMTVLGIDYGPMVKHEQNAANGDLFTSGTAAKGEDYEPNPKGKVIDLVLPVIVLIVACVIGMVYTGGFFDGETFIDAFSNSDASVGLSLGSIIALIITFVYYLCRRLFTLRTFMETIPEGFKAMVPAILILTFAWTLCGMTGMLGAKYFVSHFIANSASALQNLLPAIIFLIATGLAFATGTSWGTFGILIPIVIGAGFSPELQIIAMSACLAGAVCGDHCSPISDTTIMASAGAQSDHINHVNTQLPYALTVAGVSFVSYIIAGFVQNVYIALPIAIVLMVAALVGIKAITKKD